jgi:hypothetical protein
MFGLNKKIFTIALIASIISILLAVLTGVIEILTTGFFAEYDPSLAILTLTLVAIIWYTAYSSQSIIITQEKNDAKTVSLATAILGELENQYNKYYNLSVNGNYSSENDNLTLPMLEQILKSDISHFPNNIVESLSTFYYQNDHLIQDLESGPRGDEFQRLRGIAADRASHLTELVEMLTGAGGTKPIAREELPRVFGGAVLPRNFPQNPFAI